ncbi:Ig-like domain-containing protein [Clostridium botulinum]|uniref:Ig-like domain-containing protein n=1 Tax=Clostridium botulinum TaxID=1491 RepID=UPI000774CEB5|nr:Ig-like domain-containing protein [Clostridium botulinum]
MKNCFKKILIMLVMVLTIIGVGAIQNGTIANAATVGEQLTQPEEGWKRYDNDNDKIKYNGEGWQSIQGFGNKYGKDTFLVAPANNSTIEFKFYGSKLRIYGNENPGNIITIDGQDYEMPSYRLDNSIRLCYENTSLNLGNHNVKIKAGSSNRIDLDAIDTDGNLIGCEDISLSLDKSSLTLKEYTSEKLTATTTPSAINIDWSSSDETVATVDSNGNVKAIKEGQATITAKIKGTDTKADCIVTVTKEYVPVEPEQPTNPEQEYIVNTAYAKGDNTNNASGQVSIIFKGVAEAQLKVIKTADVDSVYVGDNFTYTIEVTNTSDKIAKSVVIKDSAPNHIQFIPSEVITTQGKVDSSSTSKSIIVNVGDIPPLGKVIIKIPVLVVE